MAEKVPATRRDRAAISHKMPPALYDNVNKIVFEEKAFSTVSDGITQYLSSFVDNHHDRGQFGDLFRDSFLSDRGQKAPEKPDERHPAEWGIAPEN
jgi:hypothetical protein